MANPLPDESEIYKNLKKNKVTIPHDIWDLIDHHIGNDLHIIQFIAGSYVGSDNPEDIPVDQGNKIIAQCDEIKKFFMKLREATREVPKKD